MLVAFAGLGAALLAARAAGAAAGWGFQFQSPVFVAAMTWLLFAVGLNLSGVFEIGTGLAGTGHGLARAQRATGQLLHRAAGGGGGDALHRAVHGGRDRSGPRRAAAGDDAGVPGDGARAGDALCACWPRSPALGRATPRPGRWMEVLRQALAFPMYGASAWLIWVISQEAGPSGVLGTAVGLVLLGFAAWVLGITQRAADRGRRDRPGGCRRLRSWRRWRC